MHSDTEYRSIESPVSHLCRILTNSEFDWLAADEQFSPNVPLEEVYASC